MKLLLTNKEARGLEPIYKVEAGLVLTGSETVALRNRDGQLGGAHLKFLGNEPFLINFKIGRYARSIDPHFDPERKKKLLLKGREVDRVRGLLSQKGYAAWPVGLYTRGRFLKVEIWVGRTLKKWETKNKKKAADGERRLEELQNWS